MLFLNVIAATIDSLLRLLWITKKSALHITRKWQKTIALNKTHNRYGNKHKLAIQHDPSLLRKTRQKRLREEGSTVVRSLHGKENFENRLWDILNILPHCLKTVEATPLKTVYVKTTIESVNNQILHVLALLHAMDERASYSTVPSTDHPKFKKYKWLRKSVSLFFRQTVICRNITTIDISTQSQFYFPSTKKELFLSFPYRHKWT